MPGETLQRRIVGASGDTTLREAFNFYRLVKEMADRHHAGGFAACQDAVDFGCGWGRITRFFVKDMEPTRLVGLDCVELMIDVAQKTNPWATFLLTTALPPSGLADASADLVFCYSVFSHLSEEAHLQWVREFRRLLRPGGLLVATTRPREFLFEYARLRARTGLEVQDEVTSHAFPGDAHEWLARYDRGEFLYSAVGVDERLPGDFYGEAFIPLPYARRAWSAEFELVDHVADPARCPQEVLVARRRP
jgi:SAM-dependent methyltransferase